MKGTVVAIVAMALVAAPALAQKVTVDYAHDYDGESVKTFQYVDTQETNAASSLMADRIVSLIKQELREGGLTEVEENPDIYVTYHVATEELSTFTTTGYGYGGYWGGWGRYGGGMVSTSTYEQRYTEGTLVIDAYDASEKKLIWRGTGTVTVKSKPEKQIKQVEKILKKIGNRWDKILKGMGK